MKYFLHISYNGGNYHGWQSQPNTVTVQGVIEEKLKCIFKTDITVFGCGRTDSGVHASQYFLNITIKDSFDFDLKFRLNKHLPNDIVVYDIIEVEERQHARYDAISRTYDYFIHLQKDPVLGKYSSYYELEHLDFDTMQKAAELIHQYDNFEAVCKQPDLHNHTICHVKEAKLYVNISQQRLRFSITADRFLRGMIRILVGHLLKVGTGELSLENFELILSKQQLLTNKKPAFANGLYLSGVSYPYIKVNKPTNMCAFLKTGLT
ncbi:MAG: tRNA pseudouridine(38-40) synthase TruA [Flavobacteriaceae bacterium]